MTLKLENAHRGAPLRGRTVSFAWRLLRGTAVGAGILALLTALFYAEENQRGPRTWKSFQRQLAAKKVELDWHALLPPPAPDEDNFATTPFFASLFDFVPGTYTPRDMKAYNRVAGFAQTEEPYADARRSKEIVLPMSEGRRTDLAECLRLMRKIKQRSGAETQAPDADNPVDRKELAGALLQAMQEFLPVLDELDSASRRQQCRFNLNYAEDYPWNLVQPYLPILERVSRVLMWRSSAQLALQNSSAASEDVLSILALAAQLRGEFILRSFVTQVAMLDNARQIIWEGLADHLWSEKQLSEFEARLALVSVIDLRSQLRFDRAAQNSFFDFIHKNPNIVKGWSFGPGLRDKARGFFIRNMPSGWMNLEQISYNQLFDELVSPGVDLEIKRVHPRLIDQATRSSFSLLGHRLVAGLLINSAGFLCSKAAVAQTGLNQAILACVLERYRLANGKFPQRLDDLDSKSGTALPVDIITGEPMKYRRTGDDSFLIYSVGWNEKDDNGRLVLKSQTKTPDTTQGDWPWPAYPDQ